MNIRDFVYFLTVAEKQSISLAAQAVFIEQSSLSKIIAKIEEHYNTTLFKRTPQGVKLTPSGEALIPYARLITSAHKESLRQVNSRVASELSVYYCNGLENWLIPTTVVAFQEESPDVKVKLFCCNWDALDHVMHAADMDVLVAFSFAVEVPYEKIAVRLINDTVALSISPNHPFSDRESVTLEEIESLAYVFVDSVAMRKKVDMFHSLGLNPKVQSFNNASTANSMIMTGQYATIRNMLDRLQNPYMVHIPIRNLDKIQLLAIYDKNNVNSNIQPFINFLKETIKQNQLHDTNLT